MSTREMVFRTASLHFSKLSASRKEGREKEKKDGGEEGERPEDASREES